MGEKEDIGEYSLFNIELKIYFIDLVTYIDALHCLFKKKGTPGKASPLKISLPGEVDLMQEVLTHAHASDAV